jgi:hypothetical protein
MPASYNDSKHWRERAAEMRALADAMNDVDTAAIMLRLAADYDRLADRAEARSRDLPGGIWLPFSPSRWLKTMMAAPQSLFARKCAASDRAHGTVGFMTRYQLG